MASQRRTGVILGYANIIVKNLVNLVYTPMLLSFVGQAEYGVYQTSYSFVFSLTLLSFGFSQAYVRFYTQRRAHGTEVDIRRLNGVYLVLYLIVSAVALALGLAFAANAGTVFSASFTSEQVALAQAVMSVMAGSIAVTLLNSVFDAYVLAHEEFRFQQTRQIATTVATPFVAYALLLLGMGVVGVAVAQLAVNVLLLVFNAAFCIGRLRMRFDVRRLDGALFRSIAAFSAWIFANQVCDLVNQNVPNILLGALSGASAVAVFAVSVQVRNVFVSLSATMSSVFTPENQPYRRRVRRQREALPAHDTRRALPDGTLLLGLRRVRPSGTLLRGALGGAGVLRRLLAHPRHGPSPRHPPHAEHGHRDPARQEHAPRQERRPAPDGPP